MNRDLYINIDHYVVLGLPSGEEGPKLSEKEISKAYRSKALVLHPDKRPDDPNAQANFQKHQTSFKVLKDETARKLFDDDLLRVKREKLQCQSQQDCKRRELMSDLEERERASFAPDANAKARDKEDRIARKLEQEITRIRAMQANKGANYSAIHPAVRTVSPAVHESMESDVHLVGAGYQAFEV